jgi:hypothetical protein
VHDRAAAGSGAPGGERRWDHCKAGTARIDEREAQRTTNLVGTIRATAGVFWRELESGRPEGSIRRA